MLTYSSRKSVGSGKVGRKCEEDEEEQHDAGTKLRDRAARVSPG